MNERIICAANWYKDFPLVIDDMPKGFIRPINCDKGIVFAGHRHHNCLYQMVAISGKMQHEAGEEVQGFLTSKNRFVDRKEALQIALLENQVLDLNDIRGKQLFSEDLY